MPLKVSASISNEADAGRMRVIPPLRASKLYRPPGRMSVSQSIPPLIVLARTDLASRTSRRWTLPLTVSASIEPLIVLGRDSAGDGLEVHFAAGAAEVDAVR